MSSEAAASSASSSSSTAEKITSEQQSELNRIINTYKQLRTEVSDLANKISELEGERQEHQLVINALKDLSADRKCYRSIGGVLVERTVGDVLPNVQKNLLSIQSVLQQLSERIKLKEREADEWRVKYNITETTGMEQQPQQQQQQQQSLSRQQEGGTGVLV